jgi:alpha-glucosidase
MKDFGFDISDYKAIDPTFGSMSDFDILRKKTKESGEIFFLCYKILPLYA